MEKKKADLHNHLSTFSNMNGLLNKTVDKARNSLGAGGVIALVNYEDKRYESFIEQKGYERVNLGNAIYVPEKDILIIKGQEIPTKQRIHPLVLGLKENKNLKSGRTLEDTCKEAKDNNGIIIAVHPFYVEGVGPYLEKNQNLLSYFDGVETHNGEAVIWIPGIAPANANKKAQEFYNKKIKLSWFKIGGLSFSDGHSIFEIGSSYTTLEKPDIKDSETLNKSLRKSIKHHRDFSEDKRTNSNLGALDHIFKLARLKALQKIGLIK